MSLKEQLATALDAKGSFQGNSQIVEVASGPRRLSCQLVALDRLACAVDELSLETTELADVSMARLKQLSEQLAARLTYLLEPIGLVEVESEHCLVQLRSKPPHRDEEGASYYELLARRGGRLSLCRYATRSGQSRERVAAHLTREVLLRLAGDFEAALG